MNYLTLLVGYKELALRGLVGQPSLDVALNQIGTAAGPSREQLDELRKQLTKLAGPLELRSEFSLGHITIDIDEIAREIAQNHAYLSTFLMRAAGSLLILAYELSEQWHDTRPLWQFLRHCRHAAAHGGNVSLIGDEPKYVAQWGCLVFVRTLQGFPLFKGADGTGMLSPGDPIRLLYDIEQAYPQMIAQ